MIKGLSHKRQFERAGIIKKGIKVDGQTKEVDYFVCPDEVKAVMGDKPQKLPIILPVNDWEEVFRHNLKWYGSNGAVKCIGDGITAKRVWKYLPDTLKKDMRKPDSESDFVEMSCPCPMLGAKGGCGPSGILSFMIPDVTMNGVYQIFTRSKSDIISINSAIAEPTDDMPGGWIRNLFRGRIAGIPLILIRLEYQVTVEGKRQTHWKLALQVDHALAQKALSEGPAVSALPEPHQDETISEEEIPHKPEDQEEGNLDDILPAIPRWKEQAHELIPKAIRRLIETAPQSGAGIAAEVLQAHGKLIDASEVEKSELIEMMIENIQEESAALSICQGLLQRIPQKKAS